MQYTSVSNPRWANKEHTAIDCTVSFVAIGEVPFTASPEGDYAYTHEIFDLCVAGQFGVIQEYIEPVFEAAPVEPTLQDIVLQQQNLIAQLTQRLESLEAK